MLRKTANVGALPKSSRCDRGPDVFFRLGAASASSSIAFLRHEQENRDQLIMFRKKNELELSREAVTKAGHCSRNRRSAVDIPPRSPPAVR